MKVFSTYLAVFGVCMMLLSGCGSTPKSYNDFVMSELNATNSVLEQSEDYYFTKDNDSIIMAYEMCEKSVNHLVDTLNAVAPPEGADELQSAALNLAMFYQEHVLGKMAEIVELNKMPDRKSVMVILTLLNESYEGQDSLVQVLQSVQEGFANKQGAEIIPPQPDSTES